MAPDLLIPSSQLPSVLRAGDFASQCHALLIQQKLTWELLRANYATLDHLETREIVFDHSTIRLQFNPRRLTSSAAKVDDKSIRERKCFLCPGHLPAEQRALPFEEDYLILCNPFPIFPEHLTIPHREHVPQLITDTFGTMLELTRAIGSRYTVFYNGPRCGASAPDHLHFQAGSRNLMPLEAEYPKLVKAFGKPLVERSSLRAYAVIEPLRRFFMVEAPKLDSMQDAFKVLYTACQASNGREHEPMLNILANYESGLWRTFIFPRAKHRPSFFFADGDANMLLSPAAVDLGGLCVTPLEKDFRRLTASQVAQMFQEVCLSADAFETVANVARASLVSL